MEVYKNYYEMIAHKRHKDVEVKNKAVKVEDVKPKKKGKKKEDK